MATTIHSVIGEDNQLIAGAVVATAVLAATAVHYVLNSSTEEHGFPKLHGIQLYHAWNFFERRYDFLQSKFKGNSGKSFSFNVLNHHVIALHGEDARRVFYTDPYLNSTEGYKILKGMTPQISDVDTLEAEKTEELKRAQVRKKLNTILSTVRLQDKLPALLLDVIDRVGKWGNDGIDGKIDPFPEIYGLVFVTTARAMACDDLAKNNVDLKRIEELLLAVEGSPTTSSVILPWFPNKVAKIKKEATTELFNLLHSYVEERRSAEPTNDAIDVMIADGDTNERVAEFVMGMLFAGTINTGIMASWTLVFLGIHPDWKAKCKEEIKSRFFHSTENPVSSATLYEKLSTTQLSTWEDDLPVLDACIRECQRILVAGSVTFRRHIRKDPLRIGEKLVKTGDFLAYPLGDVNLNPEYYPEPQKYDPGRWLRPDPVPDTVFPFLGWGAGRHLCTGMRIAKLEIKLILAVFLARNEYSLVDKDGKFPNPLPFPDMNCVRATQRRPPPGTCYLDFKRVVE